jgi:hypothetical protein
MTIVLGGGADTVASRTFRTHALPYDPFADAGQLFTPE